MSLRTDFLLLLLLVACDGVAEDAAAPPASGDAKPTTATYGEVFAMVTTSVTVNGQPGYVLGAKLEAASPVVGPCLASAKTVGACCYLLPSPTTSTAPGTPAGVNPDGGPTYVDESAGKITFSAPESQLGSMDYGQVHAGFGQALGYPNLMINPTTWTTGDLLGVSARGADGHVPAFDASINAVDLPNVAAPDKVARTAALTVSWKADPNATTMTLTLSAFANQTSHGTIVCTASDSALGLSVDTSLLAKFAAGDQCWGSLERSASKSVELAGGHVTFTAKGEQTFIVPVE
jgi:hypothetical protein